MSIDRQDSAANATAAWWFRIVTGLWLHAGFIGTSIGAGRVAAMLAADDVTAVGLGIAAGACALGGLAWHRGVVQAGRGVARRVEPRPGALAVPVKGGAQRLQDLHRGAMQGTAARVGVSGAVG
ncbi:MAG: hypothetical protein ABI920_13495 [Casimicrobiaceae bacterium]